MSLETSSRSQVEGLAFGTASPTNTPAVSAPKASDPLASKVTAVLSTSYSDVEFREALSLLDKRGVVNNAKTRRQLRLDLHKEAIDCNGEIIGEFGRVAEQLHRIKATVGKLNSGYEVIKNQVASAHSRTLPALADAASLLEQRRQIETRQEVLNSFKNHFIMSDDDIVAMTSTMEPVDQRFFDSLLKAKKISQDCELLLGFEKQTLGLELMDQTSKNINLGFQKLYKWVQREFKTLNLESPQMNPSIRRALRVLAERPSLFQNCLDSFAEARERILSEAFHCALTGTTLHGTEDPTIKPIDLTAHDPLRYVGDMLAWVHSATVSERETLEVLFVAEGEELAKGLKSGRDAEFWRLVADEIDEESGFNALKALNELVDRDISGAARVMRQRIEQVVQSNEDVIAAYKVATLINFYRVTFEKLLGLRSGLLECVESLEIETMRQFRALIRDNITAVQSEFQQTPPTLEPPGFLQASLKQLDVIIRTYQSSVSASENRETEFQTVLAEAFEPFMSGCEEMARTMEPPSDAVFLINCRLAAAICLDGFEFTSRRAGQLRADINGDATKLIESQYSFFRKGSGLNAVIDCMQDVTLGQIGQESLNQASQELDDFLPSALMDAMERLKSLQDSELAHDITAQAAERFCSDFDKLEQVIVGIDDDTEESDNPSGLRSIFPRTSAEIRVLLS